MKVVKGFFTHSDNTWPMKTSSPLDLHFEFLSLFLLAKFENIAILLSILGLLLLLFGQHSWRAFLGLIAFGVAGGACGYLLLYHTSGLPSWGAGTPFDRRSCPCRRPAC